MEQKVREICAKYEGQCETYNNGGFKEKWFDKLMRLVGFYNGAPWCCFMAEQVWKDLGAKPETLALFSGSTRKTWENLKGFKTNDRKPGDLVIWGFYKNGKLTPQGHIGVLVDSYSRVFEGNTSQAGSREGTTAMIKIRRLNVVTDNGLNVLGFISFAAANR